MRGTFFDSEDILNGDEGIQLGRWGANYFEGEMDNVMIFNEALTAEQVHALYAAQKGTQIEHDAAGNMTVDKDRYIYHYDYENRIAKIEKPDGSGGFDDVAEMDYDALGRRICKVDSVSSETTYAVSSNRVS